MNIKQVLIVLDSYEYKRKESLFKEALSDECTPIFTYSEYENKIIQFYHKLPFVGGSLTRLSYWWISFVKSIVIFFQYKNCKTKIFVNPIVAIFYSSISRLLFRTEKINVAGFLFEEKSNKLYLYLRKCFVNYSYKKIDKIFVFSQNEVITYKEIFPELANKFIFVKYGRDYQYSQQKLYFSENSYISSGGRSNRDFNTLCEAMSLVESQHPDLRCTIATRPEVINSSKVPKNTFVNYNIRLNQFGSFIESSLFFILPIIDTKLSAGHMALLEAMSLKKIIITADIPSIRDYVSEQNVLFYQPQNAKSLSETISFVYTNQKQELVDISNNAQKLYYKDYTFNAFLKRLVQKSLE